MQSFFEYRHKVILWQLLFLIIGTSWLLAPHLNHTLSYRTSLISQYELPGQPFNWLFRAGDFIAAGLLLFAAFSIRKQNWAGWILLAASAGMMFDPLLSTSCKVVGDTCREYFSIPFLLHAIETTFTSSMYFVIAVYDAHRRKKLVSISFAIFQLLYGLLFITQLADKEVINTAAQYVYQTSLIVWAAWFVRDMAFERDYRTSPTEGRLIRGAVSIWAFLNGILAIVISLAHINLLGRINGLYFSGDSAWLAQHGIIVGIIMLYLSRHLARGEARARQIFLLLSGIETLKYAVISPRPGLMIFYLLTFCVLFVLRDDFDRGSVPTTWSIKVKDLYFLVSGILLSALIGLIALDRDGRISLVTSRAIDHLSDYAEHNPHLPHSRLESVLLAHSISIFMISSAAAILWVIFKPQRIGRGYKDYSKVEALLNKYSASSEDFFKLWPRDKDYFWAGKHSGFVAYRIVGPVAFALADPIGPDPTGLIDQFNGWCHRRRLKVCYLPVYENSLDMYRQAGMECLQIGSSALIDIEKFESSTAKDKWWRWRLNKARKAGYQYMVAEPPHSREFIRSLKKISDEWLNTGGHAERGFALGHFDDTYLRQCRIHYLLDQDQRIIAFVNELPQFKSGPVATIDLLRYSPAFSDSMAFLLYSAIARSKSSAGLFDLGFVPFARAKGPILTIAKTFSTGKFSSGGLEQFKNKFDPDWQPNYLVYKGDLADLAVIALNIEKAMEQ